MAVGGDDEVEDLSGLSYEPESEGDVGLGRETRSFSPEQRLMAAILRMAVNDCKAGDQTACDWIFLEKQRSVFTVSAGECCDYLYMEVDFIRLKMRESLALDP